MTPLLAGPDEPIRLYEMQIQQQVLPGAVGALFPEGGRVLLNAKVGVATAFCRLYLHFPAKGSSKGVARNPARMTVAIGLLERIFSMSPIDTIELVGGKGQGVHLGWWNVATLGERFDPVGWQSPWQGSNVQDSHAPEAMSAIGWLQWAHQQVGNYRFDLVFSLGGGTPSLIHEGEIRGPLDLVPLNQTSRSTFASFPLTHDHPGRSGSGP
jgi:hypothetical protein